MAPRRAGEIPSLYSEALGLGADLVEVRLDALPEGELVEAPRALSALDCGRILLTYRSPEEGGMGGPPEGPALAAVRRALEACPGSLLDVDLSGVERSPELRELALSRRDLTIASRHYGSAVGLELALSEYEEALRLGRYAKLVFRASSPRDNLIPLRLYRALGPERLISFCSGVHGTLSRAMSAVLGAPIAYASLPGRPVAEGQMPPDELRELVEELAGLIGGGKRFI